MVATVVKDIESTKVQEFASGLRGGAFQPSDEGYEQARKVYNAMIDKRPGLIARCVTLLMSFGLSVLREKMASPLP